MKKILLTGFEAFAKVDINPSQKIVEALAQRGDPWLHTAVLPVRYDDAARHLLKLMQAHQPDAVLMLGVAQKRSKFSLERIALNLDDASIPDNAGVLREGLPIDADGPLALETRLPLDRLYASLQAADIPVGYSNHAGTYLCNHIFYAALRAIPASIACGFVHLPGIGAAPDGLPLELMQAGVALLCEALQQEPAISE